MSQSVQQANPFRRVLRPIASRVARRAIFGIGSFFLLSTALSVTAADAVIMPDGFVIQGKYFKETELVMDVPGRPIRMHAANGFDIIENGPVFTIFSTHVTRGGKLEKDIPAPEYTVYRRKLSRVGMYKLPEFRSIEFGPWDEKWNRTLKFIHPTSGYNYVKQTITHLDPKTIGIQSSTNAWRLMYHTNEWDPAEIRRLLGTHPELADVNGKAVPERRLAIAKFLLDAGWPTLARAELEKLKTDAPMPWAKEADEHFKELQNAIDREESRLVIDELSAAVSAGRYEAAKKIVEGFTPKAAEPRDTTRLAVLKAEVEPRLNRYELTKRLLRETIEQESGLFVFYAHSAAAGIGAGLYHPRPTIPPESLKLITAAGVILEELHPDSISRIDLFTTLAKQAEDDRMKGISPVSKAPELMSLAITGWLKGKNGAEPNAKSALRFWEARKMALDYLQLPTRNDRVALLDAYLAKATALDVDELTQLISFLPPTFPEDLKKRSGDLVDKQTVGGVDRIYRCKTPSSTNLPDGVEYHLRLPDEYSHGRSYPVLIALNTPEISPERLIATLSYMANKFGYIVAAPTWCNQFGKTRYEYSSDDHPLVEETLHDLLRHFQINPDKVFLYGHGEGANFAIDMGMAHPDLFAGVIAMSPNPVNVIFNDYWRNAQKLPMYMVTGEMSGAFNNIRRIYEKWMTNGFPSLLTVYKGRGGENFPQEQPRVFDWMSRKTRARGTASLRLNQARFEPWQVLRDGDARRFYWVGVAPDGLSHPGWEPGRLPNPAQFRADIIRNGVISIDNAIGVKKFIIWIEKDLIDWTKPLVVMINKSPALNYRPKVLKPDLRVLFEELHRTGDRKMLYLGKVEIDGPG